MNPYVVFAFLLGFLMGAFSAALAWLWLIARGADCEGP